MTPLEAPAGGPARAAPAWLGRISWLGVLVAGVLAYVVVLRTMVRTENLTLFPALIFVGAVTVPLSVLAFAVAVDGLGDVPTGSLVTAAVVGGLVGIVAASTLEYDALKGLGGLPMVFVGLIEEAAKLIVPALLYLLLRPRTPRGGVLVGIASGLGFATLETMGYGFQVLLNARSIAAVDDTLLLRALLSPACHIAWTGMTVAMLWRINSSAHRFQAVLGFVGSYLLAVALHAAWDGSQSVPVHAAVAGIGLVILLVFVVVGRRGRPA